MTHVWVAHNCAMSNYPQVFATYTAAVNYVAERTGRQPDSVDAGIAEWRRDGQTTWRVIERWIQDHD